jgi:hypothetical protein
MLSDHLGDEKGFRVFALRQGDIIAALEKMLAKLYEVVNDAAAS